MEDKGIIELYFNRDENAIRETQNKYGNYCYSIAYHILYDAFESDECVNDTWLGAWNAMPPAEPDILSCFLGKITRNLSLKKYRDKTALKRGNGEIAVVFEEIENMVSKNDVVSNINESELVNCINTFLRSLNKENRIIFVRRYYYFDSIEEICERLNCKDSKVKMSLKRTRDKLKDVLIKEGFYEE